MPARKLIIVVVLIPLLLAPFLSLAYGPIPEEWGSTIAPKTAPKTSGIETPTAVTGGDNAPKFPYEGGPPPAGSSPISKPEQIILIINRVLRWFSTAFWIFAAGFVFYAAYIYLTAGGDAERVKKAHKQLLWAVVAIAVGLMTRGLPFLINQFLRSY